MRRDVEFNAEGVTLRGWFYYPDGATGPVPTVIMAHGFSAVKEMYLDRYAEAFSAAGLGVLVFDKQQLQRRTRLGPGGHRPAGKMRCLPGAAGQRLSERLTAGA